MYKVLIRPVLTYASETWTSSKTNERQLSLFERKVLRCIFGVKQENWTWRERYSYKLYEIFNEPNIVNYIKVKRLAWAGSLVRMNNDRTLKKIFNTKPDGARSAGRPKLLWEDGVDQGTRILGVKNWKKFALNRDEWAKLLKKARVQQGLSSQWWWYSVHAVQLKWRSIFKTNSQFWEVPLGRYFQMIVFHNFDATWFHKLLHASQISLRFESAILYEFDVGRCCFDVLTVSAIPKITINPLIYTWHWKYRPCRYFCTCVLIDMAQQ